MKLKLTFTLLLLVILTSANKSIAQAQPLYKLPDSYHFDYQVTQVLVNKKKSTTDSCVMHMFYTKNGDYAAAAINDKKDNKEKLFVVLTRDGNGVIFDEQKKNITVISVRKMVSDLSGITKWIKMDSLIANMKKKMSGKQIASVKTGNSKTVGGYTSVEYSLSDSLGHKTSVWCAKVDFYTPIDYILGAAGSNLLKMMSAHMASHPLLMALTQPMTMITEIDGGNLHDDAGIDMHTESISQVSTTIPTSGYQLNNYSNLTLPEIFQAEMKKKTN